jgi:putative transcriptional regulator
LQHEPAGNDESLLALNLRLDSLPQSAREGIPVMSLRKCLLFAMLFTIVGLGASGGANVYKTRFDVPKPSAWLGTPMPAAAAFPWYGGQPAYKPSRLLTSLRGKGESSPGLFVPIQFKDPKDLGVGKLLVSSLALGDPNFAGTVILLVHYDEKGVLGLMLNRRTDVPISRVLGLKSAKDRSDPVYLGGPVEPAAVFALLQSSTKIEKAENIFGGVYLISDKDLFDKVLSGRLDPKAFHVYLGYAGWTQDQLRAEVQLGAWYIFPADATAVFNSDPGSLWLQMIQKTKLQWAKAEPGFDEVCCRAGN